MSIKTLFEEKDYTLFSRQADNEQYHTTSQSKQNADPS